MDGSFDSFLMAIIVIPILIWAYEGLWYSPQDPESRADLCKLAGALCVVNFAVNFFCLLFFDLHLICQVLIALVLFVPARLWWIRPSPKHKPVLYDDGQHKLHLLAILGSGGHTGEMVSILQQIPTIKYKQRTYIISSGDNFSKDKALELERHLHSEHNGLNHANTSNSIRHTTPDYYTLSNPNLVTGQCVIEIVPRARKIHQPLYTTPFTSLSCLKGCLLSIYRASHHASSRRFRVHFPDVIVTNGPATGVIVILASYMLKFIGLAPRYKMKVIYVESWARIGTVSLSGKVLLWLGIYDRFVVQWEKLQRILLGQGYEHVEWQGFMVD